MASLPEFTISSAEDYMRLCYEPNNKKVVINPKITVLDLSEIAEKEGFRLFCEGLSQSTSLLSLNVSHMSMQLEHCVYLVDALKLNKSVTKLNLHGNMLGVVSMKYFQELFDENSTLKELNLQMNSLGEQGCELICQALENNQTLTSLSLVNNNLSSKSLIHIGMLLRSNKTLTHLDLSRNKLTVPSGFERSFSKALKVNETLLSLELFNTKINLDDLKEGLIGNTSLRYLNISGNYATQTDLDGIEEILANNTTLVALNLRGIEITPKGFERLADGLRSNQTLTELAAEVYHSYDTCINYIIDALETNYSLTDVILDWKVVGRIQDPDQPNRIREKLIEMQKQRVEDLRVSMVNIIRRPETFQTLPLEMWHTIFSFVNYPGIMIDFSEEFKKIMRSMKAQQFLKEGMKKMMQALIERLFDSLTAK